jgi:signal transduction histidine kinase
MSDAAIFCAGAAAGAAAAGGAAWTLASRRTEKFARLFSFALHELNTPVTALNMTVLNLLSEIFGPLPAALKPWIEMNREQVGRLNGLVGEVRDFVHMDLHKDLRVATQTVSSLEIVENALGSIRRAMEQAGLDLKVSVPADLPSLRTDAARAARCLSSMLFHARKFHVGGAIALTARAQSASVDFIVTYDGQAMPPAEAAACLELYYPATRRRDQVLAATGLGLGLLRAVAQLIGGDLRFRVEADGRSALTLSLPMGEDQ